jgi:hypothetical protein
MPEQPTEAIINEIADKFRPARTQHGKPISSGNLTAWIRRTTRTGEETEDNAGQLNLDPEEYWAVMELLARIRGCGLDELTEECESRDQPMYCECPLCNSPEPEAPNAAA